MCIEHATIAYTATPDGPHGTVTAVTYTDEHDRPATYEPAPDAPMQAFTVERVDFDVLRVTDDQHPDLGSLYYCGALASEGWHSDCNA